MAMDGTCEGRLQRPEWRRATGALALMVALVCAGTSSMEAMDATAGRSIQRQAQVRSWILSNLSEGKTTATGGMVGQPESMAGREDLTFNAGAGSECIALGKEPLSHIVRQASATNIVIINEAHHAPQHRQFVGDLLEALSKQGFNIYAAETFGADSLDHPGVLATDGWYSNEPIFARTVRRAKALGYRLVAYEMTAQQDQPSSVVGGENGQNRRERFQAENLMAKVFSEQPDAKVVIHVGGSHVYELSAGTRPEGVTWMAERLKAATGRDPLTISQSICTAGGSATVVATQRRGAGGQLLGQGGVDLLVGHPRLTFQDGRPIWRILIGDKPVPVPEGLLGGGEPVIAEARPAAASLGEVPTDRVLLFAGERRPLMLPPGRFRLDGFTAAGRVDAGPFHVEVHQDGRSPRQPVNSRALR
ncbi:MAG: hypothetical protein ABW278_08780 [Steroidobacteraceae bacterium]